MAFLDFLFGKGEKTQEFQRFTPEQQQLQQQILGGLSGQLPAAFQYLNQILSDDPEILSQFEAPTRRSFQEETLPSIAERFTRLGAQQSSAFGQQLGKAGERLEEKLSAQRAGLKGSALGQLQSLLGGAMTPSFETAFRPGTQGLLGSSAQSLAQILPFLLI